MSEEEAKPVRITITRRAAGGYTASSPKVEPIIGSTITESFTASRFSIHMAAGPTRTQLKLNAWDDTAHRVHFSEDEILETLALTSFYPRLDLSRCDLTELDFSPAKLDSLRLTARRWMDGGLNLMGTILSRASLDGTDLTGACPSDTQLSGASLRKTILCDSYLEGADLRNSLLVGTNLKRARLYNADLTGARLYQVTLEEAALTEANLTRVQFVDVTLDAAMLFATNLERADLRAIASARGVGWTGAHLDRTWVYRRQIEPILEEVAATTGKGNYRSAMEVYLALKTNFLSLGAYEDASWAYVKEQQMEKASFFPTTAGKQFHVRVMRRFGSSSQGSVLTAILSRYRSAALYARLFFGLVPGRTKQAMHGRYRGGFSRWRWLRNWAYELLTGYGERPQMPVLWGAVTILSFFFVFWGAGNITPGGWLNALTHSISAFATVGFNTLEPDGWGARLLTAVESMLGIGFFALLIYTLGNRMSRS